MLFPISTETRGKLSLDGIWKFRVDPEDGSCDVKEKIKDYKLMAVPASFNDQTVDTEVRMHAGYFIYEREFVLRKEDLEKRQVLRFGSVTHEAWVYINGQELTHHKGGFTPFEAKINDLAQVGKNRLTVRLSNLLDYTSLPVGNYSKTQDENGRIIHKVDENFDFFNYAGIHRPVVLYSTPKDYIEDISICPDVDVAGKKADVHVRVNSFGDFDEIKLTVFDEEGQPVAQGQGNDTRIKIEDLKLWQPLNAYLYTLRVEALKGGDLIDVYEEPFGCRKIEVKNGSFYINDKSFYFKGFGKHEDSYVNGRGLNQAYNILDIELMKAMGANSFRTSHYPYAEEMMRLCDREGIVVIDEVPAVGLMVSFGFNIAEGGKKDQTWTKLKTKEMHEQALKELISRDKNHACVVMWSIANEAANFSDGAHEYFEPLFKLAHELDEQKRPRTCVSIMFSTPETDQTLDLYDVICPNRYYSWYINTGDLEAGREGMRKELKAFQDKFPDKPIVFTEYGADTVDGMHSAYNEPFSEEYQLEFYKMYSETFDEFANVKGEQLWNFADFQTKFGIMRVMGNRKGVFTRERQPKMVVRYLTERWKGIPEFGYKE